MIVPPPEDLAAAVAGGLADAVGFNGGGRPSVWPIPYFVAYWAAPVRGLRPGAYTVFARSVDGQGGIQPMPRPVASFKQSGENKIPSATFTVTG